MKIKKGMWTEFWTLLLKYSFVLIPGVLYNEREHKN